MRRYTMSDDGVAALLRIDRGPVLTDVSRRVYRGARELEREGLAERDARERWKLTMTGKVVVGLMLGARA